VPAAPPVEQVADELVAAPSAAPTIDIVGAPDVPYVPALAPSNGASPQSAAGAATKAAGLRRLIPGRRRGA
jgi:hypothetical protein